MEDIKSIIIEAIEYEKQSTINKYNERIKSIQQEENIAEIYYLLAETFHNTMKQGEIGIKLLKKFLTNNFFKKATVKNGANYIIFSNDDFDIMFSKSLSRQIKIKFKNAGILRRHYNRVNPSLSKLADLTEVFLNKKSFKNFKVLVDHNCVNYKNNIIAKVMKYINTYKKCNKKLLEKIRNMQKEDIKQREAINEENKKFKERQKYANEFVNSLTDLKQFQDSGWYINYNGIEDENGKISYS